MEAQDSNLDTLVTISLVPASRAHRFRGESTSGICISFPSPEPSLNLCTIRRGQEKVQRVKTMSSPNDVSALQPRNSQV